MDRDEMIFTTLRDIRKDLVDNHTDVVQRLTRLEVSTAPIESMEKRVKKLENWRSKIAGGIIAANLLAGTAFAYVKAHLK
jgi:uncharacterized protein (DUF697 family)